MCRGGGSEVCGFAKPCKCLLRAKIRTTAIKLPISAHIFHVAKTALHKGCRMHPIRGGKSTYIGRITDLYRDCCRESCTLFRVQRHRTPSSPIYLSEEIRTPFALSRVFLLSSGGKSAILVKKKAPSRSCFFASRYVVLKTRHVNPNIHVRRY